MAILLWHEASFAQIQIADMRPDAASPGMTIALELLAPASLANNFGTDGLAPAQTSIVFENPQDTNRVIVGPIVTSWNGRLMQVPLIIVPNASIGPLAFHVQVGSRVSQSDTFSIVRPSAPISIFGGAILGVAPFAAGLTKGNTMVVQSISLSGSPASGTNYFFSTADSSAAGNRRFLPITLLSEGPITIDGCQLSLDADTNLNGGPGGGGGGHGNSGTGGAGYTGGGSDSLASVSNVGTGGPPSDTAGGNSITGVLGGGTDSQEDQGGGGGTGFPFGTSGKSGAKSDSSRAGGYGGASAGGELGQVRAYGGGGGGFATSGSNGGGIGSNGGRANGGRFLVPLSGGSGGGAGNALNQVLTAGSGGGGGGAIAIIGFSTMIIKNGVITANGANGTAGQSIAAGGGGGSGGGILFDVRRGVMESNSEIDVFGGLAGPGGTVEYGGGAGGIGKLRIDGRSFGCPNCRTSGSLTQGPSIDPIDTNVTHTAVRITGYSEDSATLTDSLRVYYRSRHSNWLSIGTIRTLQTGHRIWSVTLPEVHDSVLYAVAFAKVNSPRTAAYDQDPQWLLSHISIARVVHRPSPYVKTGSDSLDFGCIRAGTCKIGSLHISNLSEIGARIDSVQIDDGLHFTSLALLPKSLASFVNDSIALQFCPRAPGSYRTVLRIFSNDTVRVVTLTGCGLPLDDRIVVSPRILSFGRKPVGRCDSLQITISSVGSDTSVVHLLSILPPPFAWDVVTDSIILAPGASRTLSVRFCPTDTLFVREVIGVNSDSIVLTGKGTESILSFRDTLDLGAVCLGSCISRSIRIRNIGNDTATILAISGVDSTLHFAPDLPIRILPSDSLGLTVTECPNSVGTFASSWKISTADSTYHLVLRWRARKIALGTAPFDFGILCSDRTAMASIPIANLSLDSLTILDAALATGREFTIGKGPSPSLLGTNDTSICTVRFGTALIGSFFDTLIVRVTNGACDSAIRIPIRAVTTKQPIAFSVAALDFGSVHVDSCVTDSILIANPCGPAVVLLPLQPSAPFAIVDPTATFSLQSGATKWIFYRYCPQTVGRDSTEAVFVEGIDTFRIRLVGVSTAPERVQRSVFRISRQVMSAGFPQAITFYLDSLVALQALTSVTGTLKYDPALLLPQSAMPNAGISLTGNESSPGSYDFALTGLIKPGPLFKLTVLPLLAAVDSTLLSAQNLVIAPAIPDTVVDGGVRVIDCGNLSGNVSIAGDYVLHTVMPNPASDAITISFSLGTSGTVIVDILDVTGAKVATIGGISFSAGEHQLTAEISTFASGLHFVRIESGGWTKEAGFLILK